MDKDVCNNFIYVMKNLEYDSDNKSYQFKEDTHFKKYCTGDICNNDLDKINAGCLYLFDTFFKDVYAFEKAAKSNINTVEYILIWLIYMLNLIKTEENNSIDIFYNTYIKGGGKYTNNVKYISGYNDYKDLIDRSYNLLSMDMSIIPKLYDAFNTLCEIYNELDTNNSNCAKCSEKAHQFVEKYKEFNIDYNNAEDNPHFRIFITLLIDYDNLRIKCRNFPSIPGTPTPNYEDISGVTSSSSIASKLIPILSILVAIAIFLGISYKYSLFGFRKRAQKQYLREKIKNIKKRMNR
ncbi:PIR protein [Plasmodium yoelii]|uniref:PIR protein n=2 Tax=Plasmodium yoelii TaxID=5861 RepID=A0AAF0B7N4_PLAYO|nr:PIR protein [Plasmodium yoelii]WBY59655.1 PIR protein [Plasmodium yoelii yoelii]VTZ80394.1 PIR protein [Plasmodium yoelii]|eukprot:XP_022813458.1 PIR protein [Plasmodium yoelii]